MSDETKIIPNGDPQEIAGPDGSEVGPQVTQMNQEQAGAVGEAAEFSIRDQLAESFPVERIQVILDEDGLPTPQDSIKHLPLAPKFGPDTLVCMEDDRSYVEVTVEDSDLVSTYLPSSVQRALFDPPHVEGDKHSGVRLLASKWHSDGEKRVVREFARENVVSKWGATWVEENGRLVLVRPVRTRCVHYKRMVFANDDTAFEPGEFGHYVMYRNCEARRSVGGALMSVGDEAVYACDHRSPYDHVSAEKHLDGPDRKRVDANVEMVQLFNLPDGEE